MEVPATEIPASQLLTEDITNIIPYLDKYGVCIVPLKNISTGTRNRYLLRTNFYQNANQILSEEHQIKELTLDEKVNPEKYQNRNQNRLWHVEKIRIQILSSFGSRSVMMILRKKGRTRMHNHIKSFKNRI